MSATAQNQSQIVDVYLFWLKGCPHCEEQIRYASSIEARESAVRVHYLELGRAENRRLYAEAARALGMRDAAVPLTIVGDTAVIGSMPAP